jgi:hypothetical protein
MASTGPFCAKVGLGVDDLSPPLSTKGQAEAAIRAVTRLTICGSRRVLGGFTRWFTSLMI